MDSAMEAWLWSLVEAFRGYIRTGEPLHPGYLGPERFGDSNIWGYDKGGHTGSPRTGRRASNVPPTSRGGRMKRIYLSGTMTGMASLNVHGLLV